MNTIQKNKCMNKSVLFMILIFVFTLHYIFKLFKKICISILFPPDSLIAEAEERGLQQNHLRILLQIPRFHDSWQSIKLIKRNIAIPLRQALSLR